MRSRRQFIGTSLAALAGGAAASQEEESRLAGITVLPEFIQSEGADAVLKNLIERAGANAVTTSPYVMEPADEKTGSREPPIDAGAGSVRKLDRDLFGRRELFVRTDRDRLRVHMVRRGKDGALNVVDAPLWEFAIDPKSRVVLPGVLMERTPDVFVLEPGAVVCASFR